MIGRAAATSVRGERQLLALARALLPAPPSSANSGRYRVNVDEVPIKMCTTCSWDWTTVLAICHRLRRVRVCFDGAS